MHTTSMGLAKADFTLPENSTEATLLISIWNVLNIVSEVVLTSVLLTATLSQKIRRSPVWSMLIASCVFNYLSMLLLLGRQRGPQPPKGLCLLQAMLIYAFPPLYTSYGTAFVFQMYLSLRRLRLGLPSTLSRKYRILLHVIPCIIFLSILLEVFIVGLLHPASIRRDPSGMYCNSSNHIPYAISAAVALLFSVVVAILLALVAIIIRGFKTNPGLEGMHAISPSVIIRVTILVICAMTGICVSLLQYLGQYVNSADSNIVQAMVPFLVVLTFATQRDLLSVCLFWRKKVEK